MKRRRAARLARTLAAVTLVATCCILGFAYSNDNVLGNASFSIVGVSCVVVGVLIASRRPGNPVGWLFLVGLALDPGRLSPLRPRVRR